MVQLVNSGKLRPDFGISPAKIGPVKLEIEDCLDDQHGPLNKRSKISDSTSTQQWDSGSHNGVPQPSTCYNPLDEPSPLGLRLRKSPSLLDLIQMKLSQGNPCVVGATNELGKKKDIKNNSVSANTEKLKASNFPASILRIGTWECVSRYEGDLVAKCYFAKHKLVWEILDGGLKNKIEIQWSDITAIKATCPDDGPGTLDVVLARQPLFFRETNPQPRKHTLWQATSDFTGGQASLHRRHFLQCPSSLLSKHFEKLIICDPRLNMLSLQPDIVLDSPFFDLRSSPYKDHDESKGHPFDHQNSDYGSTFMGFRDAQSPSATQSSSSVTDIRDPVCRVPETLSLGTASSTSVVDTHAVEENGDSKVEELEKPNQIDEFKVPGLHTSMSMSDLLAHIGNCISEQMTSGNPLLSGEGWQGKEILDDITQYLLSDSQFSSASDEKSLMSRVNSLCCLLQKDAPTVQNSDGKTESLLCGEDGRINEQTLMSRVNSLCSLLQKDIPAVQKSPVKIEPDLGNENGGNNQPSGASVATCEQKVGVLSASGEGASDVSGCRQAPGMSRKDSVGDLLFHLPRIASLPQFLFNISEDFENQAR